MYSNVLGNSRNKRQVPIPFLFTMLAVFSMGAVTAQAAPPTIFTFCNGPVCPGEPMDCSIAIAYYDYFDDSTMILETWDEVFSSSERVRVPAQGNLTIDEGHGNTTCVSGGQLPCVLGAAGSTLSGLPGKPVAGYIFIRQNYYVTAPGDPSLLTNQINVVWHNMCDNPNSFGCTNTPNRYQFSGGTSVSHCDDGNACTVDSCAVGECSFEPLACDDGDACTIDSCDPASGCVQTQRTCDFGICEEGDCPCNGNGVCDSSETCSNCPEDCGDTAVACGNGVCEPSLGETCLSCPVDCNGLLSGKPALRFCCGVQSDASPSGCGDSRCIGAGFSCSDEPVSNCCGDSACDRQESSCTCPADCGPPASREVRGTTCDDGADNDCDGAIDQLDSDCTCSAKHLPCSANSDCCSDVCLRRGVCK